MRVRAEGDTMQCTMAPTIFTSWPQWQWSAPALQLPYPLISPNSGDWCKVNKCNICSPRDDWTSAASAQS